MAGENTYLVPRDANAAGVEVLDETTLLLRTFILASSEVSIKLRQRQKSEKYRLIFDGPVVLLHLNKQAAPNGEDAALTLVRGEEERRVLVHSRFEYCRPSFNQLPSQ